jgi:hypothetical protein
MLALLNIILICIAPAVLMHGGSWFFLPERLPFGVLFSVGLFSLVFAGTVMLGMWWFWPPWWMVTVVTSLSGWMFCLGGLGFHFRLSPGRRILVALCGWLPLALWLGVYLHACAMAPPPPMGP